MFQEWFISLKTPYKMYLFSTLAMVIAGVFEQMSSTRVVFFFMIVSFILFALGFVIWIWPLLRKMWKTSVGKVCVSLLHLFIFIISNALARETVGVALGLPAKDFDLTVNFLSLLFYVPMWMTLIAALFILGFFLFLGYFIVTVPFCTFLRNVIQCVELRWKIQVLKRFNIVSYGSETFFVKGFCNAVGAFLIGVIIFSIVFSYAKYENKILNIVPYVSFICDYKPASKYPGILSGERVCFHANGVASVASLTENGVKIQIKNLNKLISKS